MKNLKETIEAMVSPDYRERFRAEYWQTKIRYEKLKKFCNLIEACGVIDNEKILEEPKHDCPYWMLRDQQKTMGEYLHLLEVRAEIEAVDLEGENE